MLNRRSNVGKRDMSAGSYSRPDIGERSNSATVSVIIPTYNRAHLIGRAIKSVLSQSYQDFEIIIVDDCSTDNTEEVIRSLDNERLRYIRHNENKGGSAARNTGVKAARGEFIAFLDSDDEYLPQRLEKTVRTLEDSPADVGVVYSSVLMTKGGRRRIYLNNGISGNIYIHELLANYIHLDTTLVRKECFSKELFDENLPGYQDWDMCVRLAKNYKFVYIDEPLAIWYHENNRERISRNLQDVITANKLFLEKYAEDLRAFPRKYSGFFYRIGHNLCKLGDMKSGRRYLKQSLKYYPLNIKSLMALILSLAGPRVYGQVVRIRERYRR